MLLSDTGHLPRRREHAELQTSPMATLGTPSTSDTGNDQRHRQPGTAAVWRGRTSSRSAPATSLGRRSAPVDRQRKHRPEQHRERDGAPVTGTTTDRLGARRLARARGPHAPKGQHDGGGDARGNGHCATSRAPGGQSALDDFHGPKSASSRTAPTSRSPEGLAKQAEQELLSRAADSAQNTTRRLDEAQTELERVQQEHAQALADQRAGSIWASTRRSSPGRLNAAAQLESVTRRRLLDEAVANAHYDAQQARIAEDQKLRSPSRAIACSSARQNSAT